MCAIENNSLALSLPAAPICFLKSALSAKSKTFDVSDSGVNSVTYPLRPSTAISRTDPAGVVTTGIPAWLASISVRATASLSLVRINKSDAAKMVEISWRQPKNCTGKFCALDFSLISLARSPSPTSAISKPKIQCNMRSGNGPWIALRPIRRCAGNTCSRCQ